LSTTSFSPSFVADLGLAAEEALDFENVYDEHAPFVWRAVVRLGVAEAVVEDIVQEVFLVVHRRLAEFGGRSSLRTWIYGIAINVARRHRRTLVRKRLRDVDRAENGPAELDVVPAPAEQSPEAIYAKAEAATQLMILLDELDDEQREVFVLAELEELTVPEIAAIVNANVNTIYSRLRTARRSFDQALHRFHARSERLVPRR